VRPASTALWLASVALVLAGCQDERHQAQTRPVLSVRVAPRSAATDAFAGKIEARYSTNLAFRVLGRVIAREVQVGDTVRKGARLAALDPLVLDLAVRDARAALAAATAQRTNAEAIERRQQTLFGENHTPTQALEAAQQAHEAAEAAVAQARSALAKALEQRSYAELTAEYDGIVTATAIEVGQVVTAGQAILTLARPDEPEAVIDMPEDALVGIEPGSPFQIALQVAPSVRTSGTVREIAPRLDALTRSRRLRIALDLPPAEFRLGTTITAFPPARRAPDIEIPATALRDRDGAAEVWVVDPVGQTVQPRIVTVAGRSATAVTIRDGLSIGERVVTAGIHSLEPGQSVRIAGEAAP
jgi:RND family efflux transporter MFP subunit